MSKNIGYHIRLYADNTVKVVGGCFGGDLSIETANRIARAMFTVTVLDSGTPVFVDKSGRQVRLYLSVDVKETEIGKKAIAEWREAKRKRDEAEGILAAEREAEIEDLMRGLTHDEIIRKLKE